jgi:hypothetical protein
MGLLLLILYYVLGVASGQYSCPRLNTTVLGHNAGLISTHPFNNTLVIIVVHMTNSGQVAVQKRLYTLKH